LGIQTPLQEIVSAADAHRSDIVILSFSAAISVQQIKSSLQQTRLALPARVGLWAGGSGVARQRSSIENVRLMGPLTDLIEAVKIWRSHSLLAGTQ
jgi:methylmalonyl-CoA mutase cobalamin-binding subunit